MSKIIMLWATVRPDMFLDNWNKWFNNAVYKDNIELYVVVNNQNQKDYIYNNNMHIKEIEVYGANRGICRPLYYLSRNITANIDDIIMVVCDDVSCIHKWDKILFNLYENINGAIFLNDGIQDKADYKPAVTMPVMDYATFHLLNKAIYHPSYYHYYSDNELYNNLVELKLLSDLTKSGITFQHNHHVTKHRKKDEIDEITHKGCWTHDEDNFMKRKNMIIWERLII